MTDTVTGLPTHRDGLQSAIHAHGATCCYVDIDALIWLNDQYGHVAGDRALERIAHHLLKCGQERGASVYRVGGDEFLMLFPTSTARSDVVEMATHVVSGARALEIPYRRTDRPERSYLEVNVAILRADGRFAERAFSQFGITQVARDWIARSIFDEKKRIGRDAGVVVDLFDAVEPPWAAALDTSHCSS